MAPCASYGWIAAGVNGALVGFTVMGVGISEMARLTPFYREMKCDPTPPMAMRMSEMSMPSPMAEMMGAAPGSPPFGMFFNMTTAVSCQNSNQYDIVMKAAGSTIEMFLPNLTDFLTGGPGLPYLKASDGNLVQDANFASGGGRAEIKQVSRVALPLDTVLGMSATAAMLGYSPMFIKTSMTVENRLTLFGMPMGKPAIVEQWCGYFGGTCMAKVLDGDGNPIVPTQWEPAMCGLTKSVCGKEADMKAALDFVALGGTISGSMPCLPHTGLPNSTMCNIVTAPGVDSLTLQGKMIDPAMELTVQAQSEMDEMLEEGEATLTMYLVLIIVINAISGIVHAGLSVLCCRRRARATKASQAQQSAAATGHPTILNGGSAEPQKASGLTIVK